MDKIIPLEGEVKQGRKQIPVREGLFRWPVTSLKEVGLLGSRCKVCGEVFFPRQPVCTHCCTESTEDIVLSRRGILYTYTIVRHPTPGYKGQIPYAIGTIQLPDGIRILSPLTGCDFSALQVSMLMELVIEKHCEDEAGNDLMAFKFKPVIAP